MSTLTGLRSALDTVLTGRGLRTADHLPERVVPPLAIIGAGSPYVESGERFGTFAVRFTVFLVAAKAANQTATAELDDLVTRAVAAVMDAPGWGVERVDQPSMLDTGGAQYLSTTLDLITTSPLEPEEV